MPGSLLGESEVERLQNEARGMDFDDVLHRLRREVLAALGADLDNQPSSSLH